MNIAVPGNIGDSAFNNKERYRNKDRERKKKGKKRQRITKV